MGVRELKAGAVSWLFHHQSFDGGWGDQPGRTSNTLNTAEVLIGLMESGQIQAGDERLKKGLSFLHNHQHSKGENAGAWQRQIRSADNSVREVPDLVRTCCCIEALVKAGGEIEQTRTAVNWLLGQRANDGGWGFRRGGQSELSATCAVLCALLEASGANISKEPKIENVIKEGLEFVIRRYWKEGNGSFGNGDALQAIHTMLAVKVLQVARLKGYPSYSKNEEAAIAWLLDHPDVSLRSVEETIELESPDKGANYGFLHVGPLLLVKVLSNSQSNDNKNSRLYYDALFSLSDMRDVEGGFFGQKVFSWSTAKTLSALGGINAEQLPSRIPQSAEPPRPSKWSHFILGFAILLTGTATLMAYVGKFDGSLPFFFAFLMICLLLVYGFITQKDFKDLVNQKLFMNQ